jgi:integration host factor subunit alpha
MKEINVEGKTITRAYLMDVIHKKYGYSRAESAYIIDTIIEEVNNALDEKGEFKFSSFGTFKVKEKKTRIGRNPKTKVEVPISARKVVSFYASNLLKKQINDGDNDNNVSE